MYFILPTILHDTAILSVELCATNYSILQTANCICDNLIKVNTSKHLLLPMPCIRTAAFIPATLAVALLKKEEE
jgi:hypothetical protein